MVRYLAALFLSLAMLAPTVARAETMHEWNREHEDNAWRAYLKENHRKNHEWEKASKRERKSYWKWRDSHPDIH